VARTDFAFSVCARDLDRHFRPLQLCRQIQDSSRVPLPDRVMVGLPFKLQRQDAEVDLLG
jgi:hypothetical protein